MTPSTPPATPTLRDRLLPHPTLSVVLFLMWLALVHSLAPASLVMAAVLAFVIPFFTRDYWPERPKVRRWSPLPRFVLVFLWDVLVANLQVAWRIVNIWGTLQPRWLVIPLDIRDPLSITVLANVISLTPGTVSAEVGPDLDTLLVHALDAPDEQEAIDFIKRRYEAPIREIFE